MSLIIFAFLVGFASFLDPCILVTVPAYLGYLGNLPQPKLATVEAHPAVAGVSSSGPLVASTAPSSSASPTRVPRWLLIKRTLMFIAGFATIFLIVGIGVVLVGHALTNIFPWVTVVGAIVMIIIGLGLIGTLVRPLTGASSRLRRWFPILESPTGAYTFGLSMAVAWIPCAGAIMASIVALAGLSLQLSAGVLLLVAYCLGLSIPFLIVAAGADTLIHALKGLRRFVAGATVVGGVAMILLGALVLTNNIQAVQSKLEQFTNQLTSLTSWRQSLEQEAKYGSWWKLQIGAPTQQEPGNGGENGGK